MDFQRIFFEIDFRIATSLLLPLLDVESNFFRSHIHFRLFIKILKCEYLRSRFSRTVILSLHLIQVFLGKGYGIFIIIYLYIFGIENFLYVISVFIPYDNYLRIGGIISFNRKRLYIYVVFQPGFARWHLGSCRVEKISYKQFDASLRGFSLSKCQSLLKFKIS